MDVLKFIFFWKKNIKNIIFLFKAYQNNGSIVLKGTSEYQELKFDVSPKK